MRGRIRPEREHPVNRWLVRAYAPVRALRRCAGGACGDRRRASCRGPRRSRSFLPLGQRVHAAARTRARSSTCRPRRRACRHDRGGRGAAAHGPRAQAHSPRSRRVFGKIGRARDRHRPGAALDGRDGDHAEAASREWRRGHDLGAARSPRWTSSCAIPGMPNLWWMPIQTRNEMLATGVRSAARRSRSSAPTSTRSSEIGGSRSSRRSARCRARAAPTPSASTGGFYLDFDLDRRAGARATGSRSATCSEVIETAIGGMNGHADRRGPRALLHQRALRARAARRSGRARRACWCRRRPARRCRSAQVATAALRHRPADDPQRGRAARRAASSSTSPDAASSTTSRDARSACWRATWAAAGLPPRVGRPVRVLRARQGSG